MGGEHYGQLGGPCGSPGMGGVGVCFKVGVTSRYTGSQGISTLSFEGSWVVFSKATSAETSSWLMGSYEFVCS